MRVLLDTNVVSGVRRPNADPRVIQRVRDAGPDNTYLSVITIGEITYGIARLPHGPKRRGLEAWLTGLERMYAAHVLPLDAETARIWGEIAAACEAKGRTIAAADGLIAATALRHGLHVMTRNSDDYRATGVLLIDPWEE